MVRAFTSGPRNDGAVQDVDGLADRVAVEADALRRHFEDLAEQYRGGTQPAASDLDAAMEAARSLHRRAEALRDAAPAGIELGRTLVARDNTAAATAALIRLSAHLRAS